MTLKWSIDQAKGRLTFGKLIPMTGNTYEIQVSGQTEGSVYTFLVMDRSGEKCLARSERDDDTGVYTIAFNQTELRRNFEKDWHELRAFHTVVSDGDNTIAEGDLVICWNPVWTDPGTGEAYSMRGPKGDQGEPGAAGEDGRDGRDGEDGVGIQSVEFYRVDADGGNVYRITLTNGHIDEFKAPRGPQGEPCTAKYCYCTDGLWHACRAVPNAFGELVWEIDSEGQADRPDVTTQEIVQEVIAVTSSAASAAVTAKNDAVTAKAGAETARDAAVTAKNDAVTAKAGAEAAKAGAEAAKAAIEHDQTIVRTNGDQNITGNKRFARAEVPTPIVPESEEDPEIDIDVADERVVNAKWVHELVDANGIERVFTIYKALSSTETFTFKMPLRLDGSTYDGMKYGCVLTLWCYSTESGNAVVTLKNSRISYGDMDITIPTKGGCRAGGIGTWELGETDYPSLKIKSGEKVVATVTWYMRPDDPEADDQEQA